MRVTERSMARNYSMTLNTNLGKKAGSIQRLTSQKKYSVMSDNVAAVSRAMRADQDVNRINRQLATVRDSKGKLDAADQTLQNVYSVLDELHAKVISVNGDSTRAEAIATQIDKTMEELLASSNMQYGDEYVFSGTQNGVEPFRMNNGVLEYNGVDVDKIKTDTDGSYFYYDPDTGDPTTSVKNKIPFEKDIMLDIGLGMRVDNGVIDPSSMFKISFSGLDILGTGTTTLKDGTEAPNNLYNLLGDIRDALRQDPPDHEAAKNMNDHLMTRMGELMKNETDLGSRVNFLERTETRLTDQVDGLEELKKNLVGIDEGDEASLLAEHEATYNATLALGAQLLQRSLLDFLQ